MFTKIFVDTSKTIKTPDQFPTNDLGFFVFVPHGEVRNYEIHDDPSGDHLELFIPEGFR